MADVSISASKTSKNRVRQTLSVVFSVCSRNEYWLRQFFATKYAVCKRESLSKLCYLRQLSWCCPLILQSMSSCGDTLASRVAWLRKLTQLQYCSQDCEKEHWSTHKKDCVSDIAKSSWQPDCIIENQKPVTIKYDDLRKPGDIPRYFPALCDPTPARDLLALDRNEGLAYSGDLSVLFAGNILTSKCPRPGWI